MKNIADKHKFLVNELTGLSTFLWSGDFNSSGGTIMFDAEKLTYDKREQIDFIRNPSNGKKGPSIRKMLNVALKEEWVGILGDKVIAKNYLAVDNNLNLKSAVDALLKIEGTRYIAKFVYLSKPQLEKIISSGPYIKDVVSVNMACYMTHCYDGLIFYQHGTQCKICHIAHQRKITDGVIRRCKVLNDVVLFGG
jgi:hypothetical protein